MRCLAVSATSSQFKQSDVRSTDRLRLQLWSWNYAPEPTAMGPIATLWAETMRARGHDVEVVAAHPHYPGLLWGQRTLPYREQRNGIRVTRLPLLIGHSSTRRRV